MGSDMLVRLYHLPEDIVISSFLKDKEARILRVLSPDREKVIGFVRENFSDGWANETAAAFSNNPISCYIAVKNKEIIGFACYDSTAKNYFGPTGVKESSRGKGIGTALLMACMRSMRENGYGYAIIGWVEEAKPFYEKAVGAIEIPDSLPGVYSRMISNN